MPPEIPQDEKGVQQWIELEDLSKQHATRVQRLYKTEIVSLDVGTANVHLPRSVVCMALR